MKKKTKTVCIVGGGVASIGCANALIKRGYKVSIYEKNSTLGGLCGGYNVDGYNIDACFHWLMGTKFDTKIFKLWKEVGGLDETTKILHPDTFLEFQVDKTKIHLFEDLDQTQKEWINLSPSDEVNIRKFINSIKDLRIFWDYTQSRNLKRKELLPLLKDFALMIDGANKSRDEYAERFKSEAIRFAIRYGLTGYNNMLFFMIAYAAYCAGDSGIPYGGAIRIMENATKHLHDIGCDIHLNSEVSEIVMKNNTAIGIKLNDEFIKYDYVVSALDPTYTLKKLLKGEYVIPYYSSLNSHMKDNPISSCFSIYLSIPLEHASKISVPTVLKIPSIKVGLKEFDGMLIRPYFKDEFFINANHSLVSLFFDQDQDDFDYYRSLSEEEYKKVTTRIVHEAKALFDKQYEEKIGKSTLITYFGPLEIYKRSKSYKGAILAYSFTKKNRFKMFKGTIKGVNNLYFASQWNRTIGGTPSAIMSGFKIGNMIDKPIINLKLKKSQ